jgi:hypothetical protein
MQTTTAARPSSTVAPGLRPAPADLLLVAAVTLWALNFPVVRFGLREIAPIAFLRSSCSP